MLWSALDIERFVQLNRDSERLTNIKRQLADERRDWIRIDVPKGRNHYEVGDKIQYVHTLKGIEPLHPGIKDIDYNYYWNKVAAPIITRTTGLAFQKGSQTLDSFT